MSESLRQLNAWSDLLGYVAASLVLIAFYVRSMSTLRAVAIASNLMFIAYAFAAHASPVLVLHLLLLPLNLWRLLQLGARGSVRASNDGPNQPMAVRTRHARLYRRLHRMRTRLGKSPARRFDPRATMAVTSVVSTRGPRPMLLRVGRAAPPTAIAPGVLRSGHTRRSAVASTPRRASAVTHFENSLARRRTSWRQGFTSSVSHKRRSDWPGTKS